LDIFRHKFIFLPAKHTKKTKRKNKVFGFIFVSFVYFAGNNFRLTTQKLSQKKSFSITSEVIDARRAFLK